MPRRLDELLSVYVVFRTHLLDDDTLKSHLDRLVLNLDVYAFSTAPAPEAEPKTAPKEIIHSSTINASDEPIICHPGEGDHAATYIIWKVEVLISKVENSALHVHSNDA